MIQPETVYERAQYQFEDEAFDTVADLITFYVGSGRPISQASGARIITPKPRSVPLTCVTGPANSQHCSSPSSSSLSTGSPPRLPRKQQRSHSLTAQHHPSDQQHDARQSCNQQPVPHGPVQSSTLPRVPSVQNQPPSCSLSLGRQKITRVISDPALQQQQQASLQPSSLNHQNSHGTAPPKPPRVPYAPNHQHHVHHHHHHHHHHHQGYQASGSDSGNGSGDSEFETNNSGGASNPSSSAPIKGVVIRSHYNTSNDGTNGNNGNEYELSAEEQLVVAAPSLEITTALDIEGFTTLLLPAGEHRPLDPTALRGVSGMLHDSAPRVLASHLTKIDLELALQPGSGNRNGLSGLELATLPHGRQARLDLIERSECLKLVVAVTVLAGATAIERAATISKWIKVAIDTKTALGNLYGFCGVMLGLCLPQIQRLANTWHLLRQKHTDEAFSFEAKLRPTLRAMNECTNPQAPNTTLPHLLPIALLGERGPEDILGTYRQGFFFLRIRLLFSFASISYVARCTFFRNCSSIGSGNSDSITLGEFGTGLRLIHRVVPLGIGSKDDRESSIVPQERGDRPRGFEKRRTIVRRVSNRVPHKIFVGESRSHRGAGGKASEIHTSVGRDVRQMFVDRSDGLNVTKGKIF